ncbi:DUF333 domain-containing protein [Vibrio maerlii]|uniref:putative hemolysin n=1 Tax=Vibrio maerlii TaxID=2231648 RepID=UPI000E3C605F|nr:DUF333 domain-containing protein [Vibrio maerlii]
MKASHLLCLIGISIITVGCSSEPDEYEVKEYQQAANPAAVYCVQQDGELETVTEDGRRVTYCLLPDDERIEQWEYYRQNHKKEDDMSS